MWLCSLVLASEYEHVVWRQWTPVCLAPQAIPMLMKNWSLVKFIMRNITGRENLITWGRMNLPTLHGQNILVQCECFMDNRMGLDGTTLHYLPIQQAMVSVWVCWTPQRMYLYIYAPINVKPHYTPPKPGLYRGNAGRFETNQLGAGRNSNHIA